MDFTASYDRITKIVSVGTILFLLVLFGVTKSMVVGALAVPILLLSYAWSPRSYRVTASAVVVKRLIGQTEIPLTDVLELRTADASDLSGCIRLWGSGGMFGYYGLFRTSKLGTCHWYVTDRKKIVVLVTRQKTALFSPDDTDGFLREIRQVGPVSEFSSELPVPEGRKNWLPVLVPLTVGVVVLGIAGMMMWSPGPPVIRMSSDSLAIQDRFYPVTVQAGSVDIRGIDTVDIRVGSPWHPMLRVNGFANPHYQSGWFRVSGGKTVRLYRTSATRLVLLPPKGDGTPVLFEVKDPEAFIERLRARWLVRPER